MIALKLSWNPNSRLSFVPSSAKMVRETFFMWDPRWCVDVVLSLVYRRTYLERWIGSVTWILVRRVDKKRLYERLNKTRIFWNTSPTNPWTCWDVRTPFPASKFVSPTRSSFLDRSWGQKTSMESRSLIKIPKMASMINHMRTAFQNLKSTGGSPPHSRFLIVASRRSSYVVWAPILP